MKVLCWNVDKGPVKRRAAIQNVFRAVSADVAFLPEGNQRVDSYPFFSFMFDQFGSEYCFHRDETVPRDGRGTHGVLLAIRKTINARVTIQRRMALVGVKGLTLALIHLDEVPSEAVHSNTAGRPRNFDVIAAADVVAGDFNQTEEIGIVPLLKARGFQLVNPSPRRPTHTKKRAIDHTLSRGVQISNFRYEAAEMGWASDHVAQVFELELAGEE